MGPGGYALLADYLFPRLLPRFAALAPAIPPSLESFAALLRRLRQRHGVPPGGVNALILPSPLPDDAPARIALARSRCELLYVLLPEEHSATPPCAALAAPGIVPVPCPSLHLPAAPLEPYFSPHPPCAALPVTEDPVLLASLIVPTLGIQQMLDL